MGWYTLLVTTPDSTGNGCCVTIWGWSRDDAVDRAKASGYLVLSTRASPSTE